MHNFTFIELTVTTIITISKTNTRKDVDKYVT